MFLWFQIEIVKLYIKLFIKHNTINCTDIIIFLLLTYAGYGHTVKDCMKNVKVYTIAFYTFYDITIRIYLRLVMLAIVVGVNPRYLAQVTGNQLF